MDLSFYKGKTVLVTGHTGFKGSWLCKVLTLLGANVIGYALKPPTSPSLFELLQLEKRMTSIIGDVKDTEKLIDIIKTYRPEIVIHMAAQAIVQTGYSDPLSTYSTNVMGTVSVCEAIRQTDCVRSFVNVTTDKVYSNDERCEPYTESDVLCGFDPYSNSKSCSELVTASYKGAFLEKKDVAVSTARAGNVIGGGDFAESRIIPSCVRLAHEGKAITVRNPHSVRPYQHVLEPVTAYLLLAKLQYSNPSLSDSYNIGPSDSDCLETGALVDIFCECWKDGARWEYTADENAPKESGYLKLNCEKISARLNWKPKWNARQAIEKTASLYKTILNGGDCNRMIEEQINEYLS